MGRICNSHNLYSQWERGREKSIFSYRKSAKWGKAGIYLLFFFLGVLPSHAQKQTAIWYFGDHAGLDFNNCKPVALTDGQLDQNEGCASIADANGNLLFYTDGITIYNADHNQMLNGVGLYGDPSSTQSAIIVPNPSDSTIYYIFTVAFQGGPEGLNYSIVDMDLDGGLGGVVAGQKNIQLHTPVAEKLTAVYHANENDIWVIAHEMGSDHFLSYLVTASGVSTTPVVSAVGETHLTIGTGAGAIGYLKASPDGTKLACAISFFNVSLELFDFDNATGMVSNPQQIADNYGAYGVEFSSNSDLLYVTNRNLPSKLFQYDISLSNLQDIQQSETLIATDTLQKWGALQIAIDGKIYLAQNASTALGVIKSPNKVGGMCNFIDDDASLSGKHSTFGLPPFIQNYFQYEMAFTGACFGEEISFEVKTFGDLSNVTWDFGDPDSGSENTTTGMNPTHTFSAPGTYTVTANLVTDVLCSSPITLIREITIDPVPQITQPKDLVQCGIEVFDLTQVISALLESGQDPNNFTITFYENQTDADAGIPGTEIPNPIAYPIETPPQQSIYVRVENEFGCYDTTSFDIIVNPKAEVDLSDYDGVAICVDLDPTTPTIGGNYEPITIDTRLSETEYVFSWSLNGEPLPETGSSLLATAPGEYTVTVTDITSTDPSCVATSSAMILQSNPPEFDVEAVFFERQIIISNVSGKGDYEFSTDQVSWVDLGGNTSLTLRVKNVRLVKVYGHDKNGCGTTVKEVWMIDYMKFFTPNQDGFNDRWRILGIEGLPDANIYVFDRYGKLLASLSPTGPGWDGIYNGHPMPANDYWFRLEYKSPDGTPKVLQENFTLMR